MTDETNNRADEPETVPPNVAERETEPLPETEAVAVVASEPSLEPNAEPEPQSVSILEPEPDIFTDIEPLAFTHPEPESSPAPEAVAASEPVAASKPESIADAAEESAPVVADVVHTDIVHHDVAQPAHDEHDEHVHDEAESSEVEISEVEPVADEGEVLDQGESIEDVIAHVEPVTVGEAVPPAPAVDEKKRWYVVKVQSGREESIKAALERRTRIEAMEHFVGQVVIPTEKVTVLKQVTERKKDKEGNYVKVKKEKRVIKEQKKFPGYLMAYVEYNNEVLSLFRETSGVGDFVGGSLTRAPIPMTDQEVQGMLAGMGDDEATPDKVVVPTLKFGKGDRVKVRDGTFAGMEGEVKEIIEPKDAKETTRVKIVLMMWGRPLDVDLEHWQVDPA